jgi:hypothetical protein
VGKLLYKAHYEGSAGYKKSNKKFNLAATAKNSALVAAGRLNETTKARRWQARNARSAEMTRAEMFEELATLAAQRKACL